MSNFYSNNIKQRLSLREPLAQALDVMAKLVGKHSKKCTFYTLRFGCSFAAVNTIKPQLL